MSKKQKQNKTYKSKKKKESGKEIFSFCFFFKIPKWLGCNLKLL